MRTTDICMPCEQLRKKEDEHRSEKVMQLRKLKVVCEHLWTKNRQERGTSTASLRL